MLFTVYQKKKFLVVDDFDNFIFSIKQMLKRLGVTDIDSAKNGADAVQLCVRKHYDVVLCDYNLGATKSGQQVLEELRYRKLIKNTDIFFIVSAEAEKDMVYGALEYQPDGYITKPVTQSLLQNRLDKLVEQKEAVKDVNRAMDQEDYSKAISFCTKHMQNKSPYRGWVLRTLANLYYLNGDFANAKKIYEDVNRKRPLYWARLGFGKVLVRERKYKEAINHLESLINDRPEIIEAYDWLAEAQQKSGQMQKAQVTLQKAVDISPRALLRQKQLAEVSKTNYDLDTATKAFRSTAKLSDNSVYESPKIYLDYTRCLSDMAEGDHSKAGNKLADEATHALDKLRRKYKEEDQVQLLSHMVEARVLAGQGKVKESQKAMAQAGSYISDPNDLPPEVSLELAETYYAVGDPGKAGELLTELAKKHADDSSFMQKVEELRDEPVTLKQRMKARELNRQGIEKYEEGALDDAIEVFKQAMNITPRHVGLILNLLQTVVKANNKQLLGDPSVSQPLKLGLKRLSHLQADHRQHKRYQHLLGKFQKLSGAK